ncbi:type II toxin-antitoxin system PemK/MazF family toxin [Nocardia pseudovaccinii]|uniref:type II toxin-antitoxin system PemK/MazF family toxin n=1 Tax=Nocardia pseudovaccinii TaxID=189540 RepID=UPI0007A48299|nr:type II toxin-antitoxin system PemK/MazF family toxin [Nocardia pseudovaccinii]
MTELARGQVWDYKGMSHTRRVLIVSTDALNDAYPVVVEVTSIQPGNPALKLLSVNLGDDLGGYARARSISTADTPRFQALIGTAPAHLMDQIDAALRATLAL